MRKIIMLFTGLLAAASLYGADVKNLRCEYMAEPLGIDEAAPRLSWIMESGKRGDYQQAYRLIIASSPKLLAKGTGDMWDTGKVDSDSSFLVPYSGKPLQAGEKYYWKVQLWDKDGKQTKWSEPASWSMGLLLKGDWSGAQWIAFKDNAQWRQQWDKHKLDEMNSVGNKMQDGAWPWYFGKDSSIFKLYEMADPKYDPAPLFRKEFSAEKKVSSAFLYICGLGYYEAYINGKRVGDHVLDPAWTNFEQHSMYITYDVTGMLKKGDNAIGVMVGRGQYNPLCVDIWGLYRSAWVDQPKLIAKLHIEYSDGTTADVITDPTWKVAGGPIVYDDTRHGELYDARLEQPGWTSPGFDDGGWTASNPVTWDAALVSQKMPPIRCFDPVEPVRTFPRGESTIYDIGENIAGWAKVTVKGPTGSKVLVEYCETPSDKELLPWLTPSRFDYDMKDKFYGSFYDKCVNVRQQNGYILRGGTDETFECHFSYKAFQFIRVTVDKGVSVERVEGIPVHTDVEIVGDFTSSSPAMNQTQRNAVVSLLTNYHSIATDCPHREKQGWTADNYMSSQAAMYNFNMLNFLSKWTVDLAGTQNEAGGLCTVAPSTGYDMAISTAWPVAITLVPWDLYRFYGDTRPMQDNYGVMERFAKSNLDRQVEGKPEIIREVLGDWVSPLMEIVDGRRNNVMAPPEGLTYYGTAAHFQTVKKLEQISRVLGKTDKEAYYKNWSQRVAGAFDKEYFDAASGTYHGDNPVGYRVATNIVPLEYGIVPDGNRDAVYDNMVKHIRSQGARISTGFLGTPALMDYLPATDPALAYKVATQPEYPGWGYMVVQGANSMWETWDGYDSRNHTPFCLISGYFYKYLAGIQPDMDAPGFKHIIIDPSIENDLTYVDAHHDSPYGRIESSWKRDGDRFTLEVTIPANTTAAIHIPSAQGSRITESGKPAADAEGLEYAGTVNGKAVYNAVSGKYIFTSVLP